MMLAAKIAFVLAAVYVLIALAASAGSCIFPIRRACRPRPWASQA
jgi:hypothetical protein